MLCTNLKIFAFDTVFHQVLLIKLENCDVLSLVIQLISNYLLKRIQRDKIGQDKSKETTVKTGVLKEQY